MSRQHEVIVISINTTKNEVVSELKVEPDSLAEGNLEACETEFAVDIV